MIANSALISEISPVLLSFEEKEFAEKDEILKDENQSFLPFQLFFVCFDLKDVGIDEVHCVGENVDELSLVLKDDLEVKFTHLLLASISIFADNVFDTQVVFGFHEGFLLDAVCSFDIL
jgi:hypothetical protein